jgi:two-component system, OmpR family, sensor histidine kinase MprB
VSLRVRLGLAAGVAVAIAVIAVAVSAYAGTRSELRSQVDQSLRTIARSVEHQEGPPDGGPAQQQGLLGGADCDEHRGFDIGGGAPGFGGAAGVREFVTPSGRACFGHGGSNVLPVTDAIKRIASTGHGQLFRDETVSGHRLRVFVTALMGGGALQVALPLEQVDKTLSNQLLLLVLIAAAGIALAALLGLLVARTALAPIARFTRQTESIAQNVDRLEHERLDAKGRDELSRLAQTFNTTLDALERSVQAQRNLVADASHELRTPIASIRANLQLLRDEALLSPEDREALRSDMIEELDELTGLVGDVVELARGAKPSGEMGDVRLDEIVEQAVERTRRRAPTLEVQTALEPTLVRGEGDRIARAVANLLDNAVKWSPPEGVIEVELREGTVSVRDHGPGFREEDLPYVFDRFHRAKEARSKPGSGLGLAIVRQAAEAHGGFVEASNAPGGGALLRIGFGPTIELERQVEPISAS